MLAHQISRLAIAAAVSLLLAGCETVSLDTPTPRPAPVQPAAQAPVPPDRVDLRPRPTPAPEPEAEPAAQAQALGAEPIHVQPLVPQGSQPAAAAPPPPTPAPPAASPASPPAPAPAPAPVTAASAPPAAASAPATPSAGVRYVCNDRTSFVATFGDVSVTLSTALGVLRLEQTVATDGARYANGEVAIWFKGREAQISNLAEPGSEVLCVEQR